LISRSRVDLPAPERPMTPTKAPLSICSDTPATATFVPKLRDKPSISSIHSPLLNLLADCGNGGAAAVTRRRIAGRR
jgi:hypothetical protein